MQYKGDDLDLRVPNGRPARDSYYADYEAPAASPRRARTRGPVTVPGETLWVDEVLLACCNYAFDVAQANGAAEVGLEHLVNALTRVDAAARQLETRGVHEGQLRRESAALIASEVPAANVRDALVPRRSGDFEDVLRRASDMANRRGTAASVDDVLWVLLHHGRDLPVVALLRRLTPDWQRLDWGRLREPRESYMPEPVPRPVALVPNDGVAARIAGIEDNLRMLQMEMAGERKLLADLVRDVQRDIVSQRGDGASFRGDIAQRLDSLERSLQLRGEATRLPTQIAERLAAIEHAVAATRTEVGGQAVTERMSGLEKAVHSGLSEGARNWANLGHRLETLEKALQALPEAGIGRAVSDRLEALERRFENSSEEAGRQWSALGGRLAAMARLVETMAGESNRARLAFAEQFQAIETGLTARASETGAVPRELLERIGGLERAVRSGFGDAAGNIAYITERVGVVERSLGERPAPQDDTSSEALLILDDRLGSIERMLEARGNEATSATHEIVERLHLLEQRRDGSAPIDVTAIAVPVTQRLETLETTSLARVDEIKAGMTAVMERLSQLEERMRTDALGNEEALRGRDQDFDFIYNEIKQLGQSQQTLNSAVSDWRTESQEHFGAIADRLEKLKPSVEQMAIPSQIDFPSVVSKARNGNGADHAGEPEFSSSRKSAPAEAGGGDAGASRVSAEDYVLPAEPGRGFWYWLFGTHNVARANRENNLKVSRMRDNIREAKERRRQQA